MNPNDAPQEHSVHPAADEEELFEQWFQQEYGRKPDALRLADVGKWTAWLARSELCSHASQEAARQDVEDEASAPQAVPLPVAKVVEQEFEYPWRTRIAPFGLSVAQCQERLPVGTLLYLAGQIAEAPTVSGPASALKGELDWSNDADWRAQRLATEFHTIYERLAPSFGYETRTTARRMGLMIAVCGEILAALCERPTKDIQE